MIGSLDSLKRHQKCMRTATKAIVSAAMKKAKNKSKQKRQQVKAAAAQVARVACSVGIAPRTMRKSKRGKRYMPSEKTMRRNANRNNRRYAARGEPAATVFSPPDFARHLTYREPAYEPPFNPEVF